MYDQQPTTPRPIELAGAISRGEATGEQCRDAARWMRDANDAIGALFAADHYDHFAARMSDSEMAAIDRLKALVQ